MKKKITDIWKFLTYDIWRITEDEVTRTKFSLYNIIKTIYLCINRFTKDRMANKASALTYSTLLAIVPILAILFAVARGFGFDNLMEHQFRNGFGGNIETTEAILSFVNSYLSQTKGGIFIGVGLVMLLWTVINLVSNIEITFNRIWEVKKARSMYRKITDYFSMFLLMPILIVVSGGLSLFMSTILKQMDDFVLLAPVMKFMIRLIPFVLTWMMFTGLYIFMPNTKVKFKHALIAGILAGSAYQAFQFLYINSQLWVSKYNAIYGSFAALPLLLLWLQLSWLICLFGAELSYASQNVKKFSFERDSKSISRRYKDFLTLLIASLIVKRFVKGEKPYTADELSDAYRIPIRITTQILYLLTELNIIIEVNYGNDDRVAYYQPAIDVNKITVSYLLTRMDEYGSENFKIDTSKLFSKEWKALLKTREDMIKANDNILLKDL